MESLFPNPPSFILSFMPSTPGIHATLRPASTPATQLGPAPDYWFLPAAPPRFGYQYKNPNNQSGMLFELPYSKLSAATKAFVIDAICLLVLLGPPTSKV